MAGAAYEGDGDDNDDDDDDNDDDHHEDLAISPWRRSLMPDDGALTDSPAHSDKTTPPPHGAKAAPAMPRPRWHGVDPPRPPRDGFE